MDHDKVNYLLQLLGHDIKGMNVDDFEDVDLPPISDQLNKMTSKSPIMSDDYQSATTELQQETEHMIKSIYNGILKQNHNSLFEIENHEQYIQKCLTNLLPPQYVGFDSNHSWMVYWLINSFQLIHPNDPKSIPQDIKELSVDKIKSLIVEGGAGGISGGANQKGHVASTYAAILVLVILDEYDLLDSIRHNLKLWFLSLKQPDGSFIMHEFGESDTRSTYCVLVCCSLLGVLTDDVLEGTLSWLNACQTYEGGFAGTPDTEAHGGYTFCALSSYFIILGADCTNSKEFQNKVKSDKSFRFDSLFNWLTLRQLKLEGGFNGRSNKLVDGCYSFWIGACLQLLGTIIENPTFDKLALKMYLLNCGQQALGGFKDKPHKSVDFYHTNYSLLGLSVSEYSVSLSLEPNLQKSPDHFSYNFSSKELNNDTNVMAINPIFAISDGAAERCRSFFAKITK